MRQYSLFVKEGNRWSRLTPLACSLKGARQIFQNYLLAGSLSGRNMGLRPVKGDDFEQKAIYDKRMDDLFSTVNTVSTLN